MVYIAPPKGQQGGGNKNGGKANRGRGKERDALASKADLLAQLTRQAEEHTRILERERAALGLPGRVTPSDQPQPSREPPPPPQHHRQQQQRQAAQQQQQQQQQQNQHHNPQQNPRRRNNHHIYTDQGNKKVFDARQIPGLGGGGGDGPPGGADQTLEQTFPDSPNFYPGRVFAIPGTIPPAPNQPQQPKPDGGTILITPWGPDGGPMRPGMMGGGAGPPPQQYPQQQQQPPGPRGQQPGSPGARGPPMAGGGPQPPQGHGLPGMHGLPGGGPRGPPPMGQQYQQSPPQGMGMPGGAPPPGMGMPPPGYGPPPPQGYEGPPPPQQHQHQHQHHQQQGNYGPPMPQGPMPVSPMLGGPPGPGVFGGPPGPPGAGPFMGMGMAGAEADPRVAAKLEAEAKKEAYRRELEEQIRAKKQAKEAEERRRREEDALWEARAVAAPQPWDPEARAGRRGGGGDPIRDEFGQPVANLRAQRGGGSPHGMPGPGQGMPHGMMQSPFNGGPPQGLFPGSSPGPGGGFPGPPMGAPMLAPNVPPPLQLGGLPSGGSVPFDGPPQGHMSPGSIPPVSPGNRRFMAAMNDLIAGPTDEQRRQKEMARQRLQMDLEEQIREKKERQARERAEEERERRKEEAELKSYHDNLNAQRQRELPRAGSNVPDGPPLQGAPSSGGAGGGPDGGMPPPLPPRRHGKGRIIDASWLDAPKPSGLPPLPPAAQGMGGSPRQAQYGRRMSAAGLDDMADLGAMPGMSPGGAGGGRGPPSHDGSPGGGGPGRGAVTTLLHQLQEEQSRMREDFARQAAAMERLANDASRALADRNEAWRELQRVRSMLAGGAACGPGSPPPPGPGLGGGGGRSLESTVIIDTHLVPKEVNSIPDELPQPVSSEVLRRGSHSGGEAGAAGRVGGKRGGRAYGGSEDGEIEMLEGPRPVGLYGGGAFGFDDFEELQAHLNRHSPGAGVSGGGAPGGGRNGRSGIPLPPGMSPPGGRQQPRIQSVYGFGFDAPPNSKYNSFFGLDQGGARSPGAGKASGGGLPNIGPPRKPPPLKPPSSPPILRGDHLPSPVKQTRGGGAGPQDAKAGAGSRVRSGRPAGGGNGLLDRPPRPPPRAASAAAAPMSRSPGGGETLPPLPLRGVGSAAAAPDRQPPRRSLEDIHKLLRRGHEDKLLRGPVALGSEDSSPAGSPTGVAAYGTQELRAIGAGGRRVKPLGLAAAGGDSGDILGLSGGLGSGRRLGRIRETSLSGDAEMMTPGRAAAFLRGSNGVLAPLQPRSFHSDSIASYRSLLSPLSNRAAPPAASGGGAQADRLGGASPDRLGGASPDEVLAGKDGAAAASRGAGSAAGAGPAVGRVFSSGSAAGVGLDGMDDPDMPPRRPVRAGRRLNSQGSMQRTLSNGGGAEGPAGAGDEGAAPQHRMA